MKISRPLRGLEDPAVSNSALPCCRVFIGKPGKYVHLKILLLGFREILDGKHDDKSENAFFMRGDMSEVKGEK